MWNDSNNSKPKEVFWGKKLPSSIYSLISLADILDFNPEKVKRLSAFNQTKQNKAA